MSIYELEINPEAEQLTEVMGITPGDFDKLMKEYVELINLHKTKSATMQAFIQDLGSNEDKHRFLLLVAIQGIDVIIHRKMMHDFMGRFGLGGSPFDNPEKD